MVGSVPGRGIAGENRSFGDLLNRVFGVAFPPLEEDQEAVAGWILAEIAVDRVCDAHDSCCVRRRWSPWRAPSTRCDDLAAAFDGPTGVEMPITKALADVLFRGVAVDDALGALMTRDLAPEHR